MRAVVLDGDGLPELTELPDPAGPGELVRVVGCGLCGSDVEKIGRAGLIGHEIAGVLDGARVTVMHRVPCGACARCLAGHESTCEEFGVLRLAPGGFAERVRATHVVALPDTFGELDGVWVEPLACILRASDLVPQGRVLVVGLGAIGQLWAQVLRRRGDEVLGADLRPDRALPDDGAPVAAAVVTAHGGVETALARLEPGGTLLVFAEPAPVSLDAVYRKELHVVGSRSATPEFFMRAIELLPELELPAVTTLPLERFDEGLKLYRTGLALKVVFTP